MMSHRSDFVGSRSTWGLVLALAVSVSVPAFATEPPATRSRDASDMVCGPRCVRFILSRFGKEVDLIDLVKEMQWPNLEAGASLEQIRSSLNARGIHTEAIRFSPDRRLRWPHPVLLFEDEADRSQGHYVVLVPGDPSESDALIWGGLEGWRRGRWEEVTRGFSGVALLTSPDPISNADAAVRQLPTSRLVRIAGLAAVGAIVAHLSFQLLARWRNRSRLGPSGSPR